VGPSLAGVPERAATRVRGVSAEDYLRRSILEPDTYVVEGYRPGLMLSVYADELDEGQIEALVAYLLTLEGDE
jgi:hypothetical protein